MPDDGCDSELLKLATDKCLFVDEGFLPFAQKYKASQEAFFEDYKKVGYGSHIHTGGAGCALFRSPFAPLSFVYLSCFRILLPLLRLV